MALIDRLKGILLEPRNEWPKIAAEAATPQSIYTGWVMIFAAIGPLALLLTVGVGGIKFAIGAYIMALIITFIPALLVDALAPTFGGTKDFVAALKLSAYSYTAAWIAGIFNLLGMLGTAILLVASIYAWCRARAGEAAADMTAEVFARAWLNRRGFRDEAVCTPQAAPLRVSRALRRLHIGL